jgi:lipopolysaccharide export system protein LptA
MARSSSFVSVVAVIATWSASTALAQSISIPPAHNFRLGFTPNRDQLIEIEGTPTAVGAGGKFARYAGNARIVLGDVTIRSRHLVIYFADEDTLGDGRAAKPTPFGTQSIHKITAYDHVVIETKKQLASGDIVIIDWRANTARLSGNVLVRYEQNILRADSLGENMKTGETQVTLPQSRKGPLGDYWTPAELRRIMRR